MRVLYVYCHPVPESYHGALRAVALAGLAKAGHSVDLCDLYAEGFDPVLGPAERRSYHDLECNQRGLESYVDRLRRAEALVVQFPTWCFGAPAMLKGFLDRLILPGVAFDLNDPRRVRPLLRNIRQVAGVSTYGRSRFAAWYMGDPPRKLVTRYLRWFVAPSARVRYLALYDMNTATDERRRQFLEAVQVSMDRF
ncbi:MAG: NAD(P)H-dependent oxidoreductase [Geminicoccaceae bacterium]